MNDVVIRARDLRKVYRLYQGPTYRFLDMFGLLGNRPGVYTEHAALDGVSLDIRRGEKVGFIGRNGAGKSTLLKLITRVIEPTSGTLDVQGHVHALLQIGTGFHPDFTGRDNVFAYLAQLGVTGAEARAKFEAIVEFAELEEYINQPVKTYSAGMAVRLMFSTATAITPELLVLDEVLGVGDAYFAQKSYEKMRELTDRAGTTLLLVTHDIYSAVKLCDRLIWIDRGRVLMDGKGPVVMKAYEDSIRQQEEARLRAKKQDRLREMSGRLAPGSLPAILEIQSDGSRPLPAPVYFSRIAIVENGRVHELPLGDQAFDDQAPAHLSREGAAWGELTEWRGRAARPMQNFGSPFHKVSGVITLPAAAGPDAALRLEVEYSSDAASRLRARVHAGRDIIEFPPVDVNPGEWQTRLIDRNVDRARAAAPNTAGVYGSGAIAIDAMSACDTAGHEAHFFRHGGPFDLRLGYHINQPGLAERAQVLVAFHRDGGLDASRVITRELEFDEARQRVGEIRLHIPALRLANGTYTVSVMIAESGYFDARQAQYFSLNPGVYACLSRAFEIQVVGGDAVAEGTVFVEQGEWCIASKEVP